MRLPPQSGLISKVFRSTVPALLVGFLTLSQALASTPQETLGFVGSLSSTSGGTTPFSGNVDILISFYSSEAGGTALRSECFKNTEVSSGRFGVKLGSVEPFSPNLAQYMQDSPTPFIELQVCDPTTDATTGCASGCDAPLSPRLAVTSTPFSAVASNAQAIQGLSSQQLLQITGNSSPYIINKMDLDQLLGLGANGRQDASSLHQHDSLYAKIAGDGSLNLPQNSFFGLGVRSSDPANLSVTDAGKTWFDSATRAVKYWDGSNVQTFGTAASSGITSMSGDVTASGTGSVVATVNQVGGVSASAISLAVGTLNSATDQNSPGALVKRDANGNFLISDATSSSGAATKGYVDSQVATLSAQKQPNLGFTPLNLAGDTMTGNLTLAAGTTSRAPLKFAPSNTLEATAEPGAVEFDGQNVFYTNNSSARQKIAAYDHSRTPASGQILVWNGASWTPSDVGGTGTVSNINVGTGLTGGPITTSGTISLSNTSVTPGSYSRANITVDSQGRLTAASSGSNVNLGSEVSGVLPLANGGTGATTATGAMANLGAAPAAGSTNITTVGTIAAGTWNGTTIGLNKGGTGATSQASAANAIMPVQTGNTGKFLTTDGTNVSWAGLISSQWLTSGSNLYYNSGNVGIGSTLPKARLHLGAGTTAPGSAPIKLTAGTNLTAAESGAMEFDGSNLFFTNGGLTPVRQKLVFYNHVLTPAANQVLAWNGSAWAPGSGEGTGTVTEIATGTGLTGGPITGAGTIALGSSGVAPGSYTRANIVVDTYGRITEAGNGAPISLSYPDVSGVLSVENGGTGSNTVPKGVFFAGPAPDSPNSFAPPGYRAIQPGDLPPGTSTQWSTNDSGIHYNSGHIGIGTTTPIAPLHIERDIPGFVSSSGTTVTGSGTKFLTTFRAGDVLIARGQFQIITDVSNDNSLTIAAAFTPDLPNGSQYSRIGTVFLGGNVGIGTSTPVSALHVQGNTVISGGKLGIGTSSPVSALHVQGSQYVSGTIGIGTSTPSTALQVSGTTTTTNLTITDSTATDGAACSTTGLIARDSAGDFYACK